MVQRPLLSFGIDDLKNYFQTNRFSLPSLKTLRNELVYRNTATYPRTRNLLRKVADRISELQTLINHLEDAFENPAFHAWFSAVGNTNPPFPKAVVQGYLPLDERQLKTLLENHGIGYGGMYRADLETLIIGREGWDEEQVLRQLDLRTDQRLTVYSQEMILSFLACGNDPLKGDQALLDFFSNGHPGLTFLKRIGFPWPSTEVFSGTGQLPKPDWPEIGVLKYKGYEVGENGKDVRTRRDILTNVFHSTELPQVESPEHMQEWGQGGSSDRLQKMANAIASFARNAKRQENPRRPRKAINDWESDLEWLKSRFYSGSFSFQWPGTT